MQPWKISIGLTATLLGLSVLLAGDKLAYLKPHLPGLLADYWVPIAWYGGLGVVSLGVAIYAAARALGLADMGRKVDLMERSIRRGEGGQSELAAKLGSGDRGQFPGT